MRGGADAQREAAVSLGLAALMGARSLGRGRGGVGVGHPELARGEATARSAAGRAATREGAVLGERGLECAGLAGEGDGGVEHSTRGLAGEVGRRVLVLLFLVVRRARRDTLVVRGRVRQLAVIGVGRRRWQRDGVELAVGIADSVGVVEELVVELVELRGIELAGGLEGVLGEELLDVAPDALQRLPRRFEEDESLEDVDRCGRRSAFASVEGVATHRPRRSRARRGRQLARPCTRAKRTRRAGPQRRRIA
jgi:hypothetical protein